MPGASRTWTIRRFGEIDSTNRYALDEARRGAPSGLVVVADHQSAGRGRLGRGWEAAPGSSVLVSVLLRPAGPAGHSHVVVMAAALALADAVAAVAGFAPDVKWPNDLVVADRKLAGLLAEREPGSGAGPAAVVVGAGLNVTPSAFPPELEDAATSCELVAGRGVDREAILAEYLDRLAGRLDDLDGVPASYRTRVATIGRRVRVDGTGASLTGTAVDVRDTGELVVRDDAGREHDVTAGDVVHLRTA